MAGEGGAAGSNVIPKAKRRPQGEGGKVRWKATPERMNDNILGWTISQVVWVVWVPWSDTQIIHNNFGYCELEPEFEFRFFRFEFGFS